MNDAASAERAAPGRIAALDLGDVRTGVALSDPGRSLARPVEVVPSGELDAFLRDFLLQEGVSTVVVGVPKTLAGEVGFQARRVLGTLSHLRERFPGVEFVEWDERLTTRVAGLGTAGGAGGHRKKKRRGATTERVDHIAAARMLDEYLRYRERN